MHKNDTTSTEPSNYYAPGPICGDSSSLPDNTCNVKTVADEKGGTWEQAKKQAVCVYVGSSDGGEGRRPE